MVREDNQVIDLTEVLADFENKWVVLSPDHTKVLAFGDTVEDIFEDMSKGFVMKVPLFIGPSSPNSSF